MHRLSGHLSKVKVRHEEGTGKRKAQFRLTGNIINFARRSEMANAGLLPCGQPLTAGWTAAYTTLLTHLPSMRLAAAKYTMDTYGHRLLQRHPADGP